MTNIHLHEDSFVRTVTDKNHWERQKSVFTEPILDLEMLWFKHTSRWHLNKVEEKKRRIHIQKERTGKASLVVPIRDLHRILIK